MKDAGDRHITIEGFNRDKISSAVWARGESLRSKVFVRDFLAFSQGTRQLQLQVLASGRQRRNVQLSPTMPPLLTWAAC